MGHDEYRRSPLLSFFQASRVDLTFHFLSKLFPNPPSLARPRSPRIFTEESFTDESRSTFETNAATRRGQRPGTARPSFLNSAVATLQQLRAAFLLARTLPPPLARSATPPPRVHLLLLLLLVNRRILCRATMRRFSSAFSRPRAAPIPPLLGPPPPPPPSSLLSRRPNRVILAKPLPIRAIVGLRARCTRVMMCRDLERDTGREGRIEGGRRRRSGRKRRRGGAALAEHRNRNRPTFTFTSVCRLFHSFHSRISLSRPRPWPRDSRRDRSTIAPAASSLLSPSPPLASRLSAQPLRTRPRKK